MSVDAYSFLYVHSDVPTGVTLSMWRRNLNAAANAPKDGAMTPREFEHAITRALTKALVVLLIFAALVAVAVVSVRQNQAEQRASDRAARCTSGIDVNACR